ncbi:hypothetical protein KKJ04_14650 [Xenorhabdus bovienii]|uniref:hypothetical protein n=1 Tax=Xenorhabdus bovienii TaxID=40576 RepID=UPI003BB179FC|nr:hypothetical protein [Xenorhabdus bovienii]
MKNKKMTNSRCGYSYAKNHKSDISIICIAISWTNKEKDSTVNATLNFLFFRELVNHQIYCRLVQPFGSMPRRTNSLRPNVFNQLPKVIPASDAASSNCDFNSGDSLTLNIGERPAPLGLLSLFGVDMYRPITLISKSIGLYLSTKLHPNKTPPNGITSTKRGLTTSDNYSIEVAMYQYTFLIGKDKARLSEITPTPLISIQEVSYA